MGSKKNQKKKFKVDSKPTRVKRSSADSADSEGQDNRVQDIAPIEQDAQDGDLELFKTRFQSEHVHYIDELRGLTAEELKEKFGFLLGDAQFIHKVVEKAIHRVNKARKNMRRAKHA
ncbi:hypothetical protein JB92DRAFT_3117768 [Gautieria morchelliformis]|nr:hypothetical protein JB92DRAFT_3117768 [Gautieria morchelliformis]